MFPSLSVRCTQDGRPPPARLAVALWGQLNILISTWLRKVQRLTKYLAWLAGQASGCPHPPQAPSMALLRPLHVTPRPHRLASVGLPVCAHATAVQQQRPSSALPVCQVCRAKVWCERAALKCTQAVTTQHAKHPTPGRGHAMFDANTCMLQASTRAPPIFLR